MKLALAAGIAAAGFALSAYAAEPPRPDANNDGWITRAEAAAQAEHVFHELDSNNDGKLDASDRHERRDHMIRRHRGDDDHQRGERRVIERRENGVLEERVEHRGMRPHGFMMVMAHNEEADLNGDNALSLEEFRNQHLRFFDASDINGDGRIRFERPERPDAPPPPPR